jgi:hypothetical protein
MGQVVSQNRKGLAMSAREIVARERLDDARWELKFHTEFGKTNRACCSKLARDVELAELRLRAVLGNIAQGGE